MSAWSPLYSTGTVAVANGGTTVTGVGTNWLTSGLQAGDQFKALGLLSTITAITDNTHLAIAAWPGTTLGSGSNYEAVRLSDADRLIAANAALAASLVPNLTALGALSGTTDELAYFNGTGTMALTGFTSQARSLIATSDGPTARAVVGAAGPMSDQVENLSLTPSVGSNALTMAVKRQDGSDAASGNKIYVGMRSSTLTSGGWNLRSIAAALSLVVPSGATLGHASATASDTYWYLQDNAGTLELAVSSTDQGDNVIASSTTISSGATSATVIYAGTGRSNVPMRKIGKTVDTQTTAGTWTAVPSEAKVSPFGGAETALFKSLKSQATVSAMAAAVGAVSLAAPFVVRTQTFSSSGTYTPNANMAFCLVEGVGAGGAGGGVTGATGGVAIGSGGGSGGYSRKWFLPSAIGASKAVVAGAGGTGVSAAQGNAGADTTFGSTLLIGKGGTGGKAASGASISAFGGGAGGVVGTGDVSIAGAPGQGGFTATVTTSIPFVGIGGSSFFGPGGVPGFNADGLAGSRGGGGSGAVESGAATNRTGGTGGDGELVVTEFCTA